MIIKESFLIIGKSGYIAYALAQYLKSEGYKVRAVGSDECDFRDRRAVTAFFKTLEQSSWTVIVTAAIGRLIANDYESFLDNVAIGRNCAQCIPLSLVNKLIFLSSSDVYGMRPELPLTEGMRPCPSDYYGLSKLASEEALRRSLSAKLPLIILRLPGVYGQGFADRSVIGRFVERIKDDQPIELSAEGQVLRDFIYLEDVCRFIEVLSNSNEEGLFNVATGVSFSMKDIALRIRDVLDCCPLLVLKQGRSLRDFDLVFDTAKINTLFPQFKFRPLTEGMLSYSNPLIPN